MEIPFDKSPNYKKGRRGNGVITHIVIHTMQGSYAGTVEWFKNFKSQVSAHYCVSKKGEVVQMVADEDTAWHVCLANPFTVGIELEDLSWSRTPAGKTVQLTSMNNPQWYTPAELEAAAELTAQLMHKHNVPLKNVIGHNDPLLKRYSNNHQDPGPYFPWERFRTMVQEKFGQAA